MASRFASTSLVAITRYTLRGSAFRPGLVHRSISPTSSVAARRNITIPSFSDIFRGRFRGQEPGSEDVQSQDESKLQQSMETNLFDATQESTPQTNFKISRRKLNLLANQIAGKPIDTAILQMQFSDKRAARRIKSTLCLARDHAQMYKGLARDKLVVAEAWVTKGLYIPRVDPKGRGRIGRKHHPSARMSVVLKEGKTHAEILQKERKYKLGRIVGAGLVREDVPIRNPGPGWAW
ncbi:ribosomal protein L22p/L17e [Ceratobasidium sp. AG-Ba]|nr:ribosomal protein L22p/L17e [Ceratobasidium sp. AG-Ba]